MTASSDHIDVTFRATGEQSTVSMRAVRERLVDFLEHYVDRPFVTPEFEQLLGGTTGEERFSRLTELTGYSGAPEGFLREVIRRLERASNGQDGKVLVGGLELPYHLLLAVLQELVPGAGSILVKRVKKLEALTNTTVPPEQHEAMQEVLHTYPVRLSGHTLRQMRLSSAAQSVSGTSQQCSR